MIRNENFNQEIQTELRGFIFPDGAIRESASD
jgi:hypothetical protein